LVLSDQLGVHHPRKKGRKRKGANENTRERTRKREREKKERQRKQTGERVSPFLLKVSLQHN